MTAVEVRVAGDTRCTRCAGRLFLTASIGGVRTVGLCPACDAADPHAQSLLGYFATNGSVQPQDMPQVSELLGHWLSAMTNGQPEPTLAAQVEAWWSAQRRSLPHGIAGDAG